jgi:pimeloyl-ACP methyl ester carboxylesterase
MVGVLLAILLAVALVPGLSYALFLLESSRSGHLDALRREFGGAARPVLRGLGFGLLEMPLLLATYPLGWLPCWQRRGPAPAVLLVHGLYHNHAAWLLFRRRLLRAGFPHLRSFAYNSFGPAFQDLAERLVQAVLALHAEAPERKVALIGHSLGGLLLRVAASDPRLSGKIACLVTLGSPHRGSTLARLALGGLGRSLRPESGLFGELDGVCGPRDLPRLALVSPVDNMVLPAANLEPPSGWERAAVPPMGHVAMLYRAAPARLAAAFLRQYPG